MKRWIFLMIIILLGFLAAPPSENDVGKLEPVELLYIYKEGESIVTQTDTGSEGVGENLFDALQNMKETSTGTIFLETADSLLVTLDTQTLLPELLEYLRPACRVCLANGELELEKTARFLNAHKPQTTLLDVKKGSVYLGTLKQEGERLRLVQ